MLKRFFATRKRPYIPGLNRPETVRADISGNILTLKMPPYSRFVDVGYKEPHLEINIYESDQYTDDSDRLEWQREGKSSFGILAREWEFFGPPWQSSVYGRIYFYIFVCRYDTLPEDMSCFNPIHFEQIALRNLWHERFADPKEDYLAPAQWNPRKEAGATWLYFEKHPDFTYDEEASLDFKHTYRNSYLLIPLDDRHYLELEFQYRGYDPVKHCLANMDALRDSVLNSIQLELSTKAKERLAEAKRKWPTARASEHRNPESWVFPEWHYGNNWKLISEDNNADRKIYVLENQYSTWESIKRNYDTSHDLSLLLENSRTKNLFAVEQSSVSGENTIHYWLDRNRDIRIFLLKKNISRQATGFYKVNSFPVDTKEITRWKTEHIPSSQIDLNHLWINRHYVAVSGKFDNKEQAGRTLIKQISKAFCINKDINTPNHHYSLYWQNGDFNSDKNRDQLIATIKQAALSGSEVFWLAHGEGTETFVRALQALDKQLSSSASQSNEKIRKNLNRQLVAFFKPRGKGTRIEELKSLCEKVGIRYAATYIKASDFLNQDVRPQILKNIRSLIFITALFIWVLPKLDPSKTFNNIILMLSTYFLLRTNAGNLWFHWNEKKFLHENDRKIKT